MAKSFVLVMPDGRTSVFLCDDREVIEEDVKLLRAFLADAVINKKR